MTSIFPSGCRLEVEDGVIERPGAFLTSSFLGVDSATLLFRRLVVLALGVTGAIISEAVFFSSAFGFGGSTATSLGFLTASLGAFGFCAAALATNLLGVSGGGIAALLASGFVASTSSLFCLLVFVFSGETVRLGVMGTTGTIGVMVEDAARDIGRDPGRERVSSKAALGMAGTVKPGGIDGVARRGCSKS